MAVAPVPNYGVSCLAKVEEIAYLVKEILVCTLVLFKIDQGLSGLLYFLIEEE